MSSQGLSKSIQQGKRRLGVHTSISGGIHLSLERAKALGCTTLQIFSHNPRAWRFEAISPEAAERFRQLQKHYGIEPLFVHTSYLINLASADTGVRQKSAELLVREMDNADILGADFVVLHPGSSSGTKEGTGRETVVSCLRAALRGQGWRVRLLLENTAGERGDIASRIKDLAAIIDQADNAAIAGICIDTCHAFQAGYDIADPEGLSGFVREIEHSIGLTRVKLIHLNDSKRPFSARVDRHEHIGSGALGREGLARFIRHEAFREIPLILETPRKSEDDDVRNLTAAREILTWE